MEPTMEHAADASEHALDDNDQTNHLMSEGNFSSINNINISNNNNVDLVAADEPNDVNQLVLIETDDGQQEVRLFNSATGQEFELEPEVAEQMKLEICGVSEDHEDCRSASSPPPSMPSLSTITQTANSPSQQAPDLVAHENSKQPVDSGDGDADTCSQAFCATDGFIKVLITQPNGERITLKVPSQTLQQAVDRADGDSHKHTEPPHIPPPSPTTPPPTSNPIHRSAGNSCVVRPARIDAMFRCVRCSTVWPSAGRLAEHVAAAHDASTDGGGDALTDGEWRPDCVADEPTLNVDIIAATLPAHTADTNDVLLGGEAAAWECAECDAVFAVEHELRRHNDLCHMPDVDSSSDDGSDFESRRARSLRRRRGRIGGGGCRQRGPPAVTASAAAAAGNCKLHECVACDKRFCTATALTDHAARFHDGDRSLLSAAKLAKTEFRCSQCRLTYTSLKLFERHLLCHESTEGVVISGSQAEFVCDICGDVFDSWAVLSQHCSTAHDGAEPSGQLTTAEAGKRRIGRPCGSTDKERQHVYDRIGRRVDGTYFCQLCQFEGRTRNQVFYHLCTKHKFLEGPVCEICNRTFYSKALLRIHRRSHTGERPFPCNTCGRAFRQNADLQSHIRSRHSQLRPFACEVCGKSFSRRYSRTVHMRCHTNERNYACPYCRKRFRASTYLTAHIRIHTGERPHACPICHKMFRLHSDIRRHIFVHSRDKIPRNKRNAAMLKSMMLDEQQVPAIDILKSEEDGSIETDYETIMWRDVQTVFQ